MSDSFEVVICILLLRLANVLKTRRADNGAISMGTSLRAIAGAALGAVVRPEGGGGGIVVALEEVSTEVDKNVRCLGDYHSRLIRLTCGGRRLSSLLWVCRIHQLIPVKWLLRLHLVVI